MTMNTLRLSLIRFIYVIPLIFIFFVFTLHIKDILLFHLENNNIYILLSKKLLSDWKFYIPAVYYILLAIIIKLKRKRDKEFMIKTVTTFRI